MRLNRSVMSAVLALSVVLLTACGSKPSAPPAKQPEAPTAPAPAAEAPKAVEQIKVTVGGTAMASLKHYPAIVANSPDIQKQTGVEIVFKEYKSTGETRKDMQLGNLDFGFIVSTDLMLDSSSDIQIATVLSTSPLEALIVNANNKNEIKSVKDLAGKPVGVSAVGSATHNMLNTILLANGMDPKDVKVMPIGADVAKPFADNQVVAAVTFEPYVYQMVESGKAVILQDVRSPKDIKSLFGVPAVPWTILAVRREFAQKNPDLVKRVAGAINAGLQKMNSVTPEEVIGLLPSSMQNASNLAVYKANREGFPKDGTPKRDELDAVVANMKQIKAVPATYTMAPDVILK